MADALRAGERLGSYEVIDRLGAGGMGEVYRARDTRLGRSVAIKVLRSGADPELLRRLDREARAASALNHPNIVQIYDVGEAAGQAGAHYVVMELVEGETLRFRLRPGPLPMRELLDLGAQLADGLAKAHRAGIVHRDLKPENVMVTPEGVLKILDFGLAKLVAAPLGDVEDIRQTLSRHGTQVGMLMGTLEYMSPEQASGRAVDHRTDQFSLGLLLHEMATGRPAFRRDTPAQVLAAVIERDPEPLDRVRPDVPASLVSLVVRCLQKDPGRRFDRTDELASELQALSGRARSASLADPPRAAPPPAAISVEVLPAKLAQPALPALYHVQKGRRVRSYDEGELAKLIRRGKLTGVELARRDDEEQWLPLYESKVYRREVPTPHDPREAAHLRTLRGLGGHLSGFVIVAAVMYSESANIPAWMGIWGVVLALDMLRAAPSAMALLRRRNDPAPAPLQAAPRIEEARQLVAPASVVEQEAARVRVLIEQRGGKDAAQLLAEVDGILKLTADLAARHEDLEEQTADGERAAVTAAVAEARARVERADTEQDRRLFERQLEVVLGREDAIAKARRLLERLKVRREVAEHQLKQLRLDLSRAAAAGGLDVPELSSRLQFIRDEVDAREEVAEIGAGVRQRQR